MLYHKKDKPFSSELFENPGSAYRGTPFWAWNTRLSSEILLEQIDIMAQMGFGGFHMHVRTGMDTPYLGDEYMEFVRLCVNRAKEKGMLAWLYDEDRWPSGAAGGLVTADPRFRERCLRLSPIRKPQFDENLQRFEENIQAGNPTPGYLLACYRVSLEDGLLKSYQRLSGFPKGVAGIWYAYLELSEPSPWYNDNTYVNTLDKAAIDRFIQLTHERYYAEFGNEFSHTIPAIFTDEPQFKTKETFDYSEAQKEVILPFTDDLPATFAASYGYDLLERLPEIFWENSGQGARVRYHYHDHICERFVDAFARNIGNWCHAHNLALTGHVNAEATLTSQTFSVGEAMRCYPHFQLPGIDMLCDSHEYATAKQAQSIARQYGKEGVLSELYGVTNWDFTFKGHKLQGDWQAALGVTIRVPHLSWMSMAGEAKRDYPASIFYQSPWYREYPLIEDHFARLNTALTRGRAVVRVGVIHPIESFWLLWGPKQQTYARRAQAEQNFEQLIKWLLYGLIDFDFIDESLFASQAKTGEALTVGEMRYDVVLVPPLLTIRQTTADILSRFLAGGGDVVCLGDAPKLVDAQPGAAGEKLWNAARKMALDRISVLEAVQAYREVDILDAQGVRTDNLLTQLRQDGDERWLFVSHAYRKDNGYETPEHVQISLCGTYHPVVYNTLTGTHVDAAHSHSNGKTTIPWECYNEDSLLLRLTPGDVKTNSPAARTARQYTAEYCLPEPGAYRLSEANVLLLDMAEYALNEEAYRPKEEVLRLDNAVRARLGYPSRQHHVTQPWALGQAETPQDVLKMRFMVHSEIVYDDALLALEVQAGQRVWLNGQPVDLRPVGWFTDKAIQTTRLPPLRPGENILETEVAFGRRTNIEWFYILGDFGVRVSGEHAVITARPQALVYGDSVPQGFAFYGANITYVNAIEADGLHGVELFVPRFNGPLISVAINDEKAGHIAFAPHTLDLGMLPKGRHEIALTLYGNRYNSFGCLHNTNPQATWYGPDCWRTEGNNWAYQYQLRPVGIMQNPVIRLYSNP